MQNQAHHVVIVGGGFGGLYAAKTLAKAKVRLTLLDRRNFHLFQPLLYQVATGALSPANIASPLRAIIRRNINTQVLLAEVSSIDPANHRLTLTDGEMAYDTLIVATGVTHTYFGHDAWTQYAPGLKTIEDATAIRARILAAFENAERETDRARIQSWLTFVIIGGGPTGVEMAGALAEIAHYTLKRNFRNINPAQAKILLIEGTERVLPTYPPDLSSDATKTLTKMGVTVMTNVMVTAVQPECVVLRRGDYTEEIHSHTILWAAGIQASPLGRIIAQATGAALDGAGRLIVQPDLTLPDHPEILVIGDLANFSHQDGKPLPGVAQVAIQQGRYAAHLIEARLNRKTLPPFHYNDLGNMAVIGRAAAVADFGRFHLHGFIGWLAWAFIHIINLVEFENRQLVLLQWAWSYFTRNRAARLITGEETLPVRKPTALP
ncbi:MAG: NAD(P)/FAD-dependent oxidoreductase [Aggregatilineales bacterium]